LSVPRPDRSHCTTRRPRAATLSLTCWPTPRVLAL
jgi:hypothetical protein